LLVPLAMMNSAASSSADPPISPAGTVHATEVQQ
jgi:hypothetical protein